MRLLCFGIPFLRERPVAALKGAGIATLVHLGKRSSPARGTGTGLSAVGAHHRWGQERVSRRRSEAPPPGCPLPSLPWLPSLHAHFPPPSSAPECHSAVRPSRDAFVCSNGRLTSLEGGKGFPGTSDTRSSRCVGREAHHGREPPAAERG